MTAGTPLTARPLSLFLLPLLLLPPCTSGMWGGCGAAWLHSALGVASWCWDGPVWLVGGGGDNVVIGGKEADNVG